ncbi:hypothetical protein [Caulobacter sp. SSI4214]|uniref:hypothetical protein n=1 Tax=Caulobacter sp. SSI4214 TaxID=2575739 RepID=UPI00143ADACF|nr:hypothetical protein [Caulobacter sp. SSI4214]
MDRRVVLRLAGRAAVAGAVIDVLGPAIYPRLAEPWPHLIYVAIDLLLLLAMLGVWSASQKATSPLGLAGFVIAVLGVMLVRTSSAKIFGEGSYMIATAVWSIGMAIWSADLFRAKALFRKAGGLWILALALGLATMAIKVEGLASHLPKLAFSGGFVAAGLDLFKAARGGPERA